MVSFSFWSCACIKSTIYHNITVAEIWVCFAYWSSFKDLRRLLRHKVFWKFHFVYRYSPGGEGSWFGKALDLTVRRRKERRARKERKAKRRSEIFVFYILLKDFTLWSIIPSRSSKIMMLINIFYSFYISESIFGWNFELKMWFLHFLNFIFMYWRVSMYLLIMFWIKKLTVFISLGFIYR